MSTAADVPSRGPFVAVGPRGVIEVWPNLPTTETVTAYSLCTGYLTQLRLYGENGRLLRIHAATARPLSPMRCFLARTLYNPRLSVNLEYEQLPSYELGELKEHIFAAMALDDDVITQFCEAATIKSWVENAATFAEIVEAVCRSQREGADA
jgi:hypothetical protein